MLHLSFDTSNDYGTLHSHGNQSVWMWMFVRMSLWWQPRCSGIRRPEFRLWYEAVWRETPPFTWSLYGKSAFFLSYWWGLLVGGLHTYTHTNPWAHTIAKYTAVCHVTFWILTILFILNHTYNPTNKIIFIHLVWSNSTVYIQHSILKQVESNRSEFTCCELGEVGHCRGAGPASRHCKASWEWCLLMHSPNDKSANRGDREWSVLARSRTVPLISSWFMDGMAGYAPRH